MLPAVALLSCLFVLQSGRAPLADPGLPGAPMQVQAPSAAAPSASGLLLGADTAAGDDFGSAVALDGDTLLVGARLHDLPGAADAGAAYVFVRVAGAWVEQARLVAPDAAAFDAFGVAVALDGDTAVVGASLDDHSGLVNAGSAWVFTRAGADWSAQVRLQAPDAASSDAFGYALALQGDTLVVGAPSDDTQDGANAGSAWVFTGSGAAWAPQAQLRASDAQAWDFLGYAAALDGGTLLLGAPADDLPAGMDAGSARVFTGAGAAWAEQALLAAAAGLDGDLFGQSVALDGETALLGAPLHDPDGVPDAGAAFVFVRAGSSWVEQARLVPAVVAPDDFGGTAVALSGGRALVGGPRSDVAGPDAGAAWIHERDGAAWLELLQLVDVAPDAGDGFGGALAVDAAAALVGVRGDDGAGPQAGAVCAAALGSFTDLGDALAGVAGPPRFEGLGTLVAGSPGQLRLSQAAPLAPTLLFVATEDNPAPFRGGTLHPLPAALLVPLATDAGGGWLLPWPAWPAGVPAEQAFFLQPAIADAAAPQGVALGNALRGTAP